MIDLIKQMIGARWKGQRPAIVIGMGHGATHWIIACLYVLLPYLSEELDLSYTEAGSLITLFHASSFVANVGSGAIVDIVGRHVQIQAASLFIGAAALVLAGIADGLPWLMAAVVVIGITNNLWHPAAISYLSRTYPEARGFALSIHTLGASLGDILAPLAAGTLLLVLTWHGTASVSALPVFAIATLIFVLLNEQGARISGPRPHGSFKDYL
ncbi:MAG: MFS transporter, partial [Methyloligellaceae bacterium]